MSDYRDRASDYRDRAYSSRDRDRYDDRYDDGYDDRSPPRRYKSSRTRPRDNDDQDYMEETTYVERGKGRPPQDLMSRSRERDRDDDSAEDIQRDFPPPGSRRSRRGGNDYDEGPRRSRSATAGRDRDRYSDDYDDYGPAGAGAGAGAYGAASRSRGGTSRRDPRDRDRNGYNSDRGRDDRDDRSGSRSPDDRKKSGIEAALEGLGLGGLLGGLAGKDNGKGGSRDRSRSRGGGGGNDRGRSGSRSRGSKTQKSRQWQQAAQAAIVAGAIEAFRARKEPGGWTGDKGKRVATAAISAGGIDKFVDKDPDKKSHKHLFEAVVGGLAANRLANGPVKNASADGRARSASPDGGSRSRSRSRARSFVDRFRSRSRGRGGDEGSPDSRGGGGGSSHRNDILKDLAAGGALAAAGKKIYDSVRSKSKDRKDRRRRSSAGSGDSYEPPSRNRRRTRDVGAQNPTRSRSMPPDSNAVVGPQRSQAGPLAAGAAAAGMGEKDGDHDGDGNESESSTDIENQRKKMKGKELITAGLALVATIHAAHSVYNGIEASQKRHKLVEEGKISPEVARKQKSKALLQDAAAVGIAALGIKGAYSEWKEMNENRHHVQELEQKRRKRQKLRQERHRQEELEAMRMGNIPPHMIASGALPSQRYIQNGPGPGNIPPPPMGRDR